MSRDFTTVSGSIGAAYEVSPGWRAGLTLSRSARAPSIDELFASGRMPGPRRSKWRSGPRPGKEHRRRGQHPQAWRAAQADRDRLLHPLLQLHLPGGDWRGRGRSAGLSVPAGEGRLLRLRGRGQRGARQRHGHPLGRGFHCRLCPCQGRGLRPGAADPAAPAAGRDQRQWRPVEGRLEVEHAFRQTRNAPLETETDGYTMVNASVDWKPLDGKDLTLGIAANNIFDVVARRHLACSRTMRRLRAATSG